MSLKRLNSWHQKRYIDVMKYYNNMPKSIKTVIGFRVKVLEHKNKYEIASTINAFNAK